MPPAGHPRLAAPPDRRESAPPSRQPTPEPGSQDDLASSHLLPKTMSDRDSKTRSIPLRKRGAPGAGAEAMGAPVAVSSSSVHSSPYSAFGSRKASGS